MVKIPHSLFSSSTSLRGKNIEKPMHDYAFMVPLVGQSNAGIDENGNHFHSIDNPIMGETTVTIFNPKTGETTITTYPRRKYV